MVAIATLIIVLLLSLIVVRIASVALTLTGLSRQAAQFQARSAWTGTGFTTTESESVIKHPVRRRIISWLILLRSAGLVTAASTLVLSFVSVEQAGEGIWRFLWLLAGVALIWMVAGSRWLDHQMSRLITWALKRWTNLDTRDYADLLHLAGEYGVMELKVKAGDWLAGRTLEDLDLPAEGVLVLGIIRPDSHYLGAPRGHTEVLPGDTMVLYGRSPTLDSIGRRRADVRGEQEHDASAREQRDVVAAESTHG